MQNKLTYKEVFWWIAISVLVISFPPYFYTFIYKTHFLAKGSDQKYEILAIAQVVEPGSTVLRTEQITGLLGLNKDKPKNLYLLNLKEEEQKLIDTSLFTHIQLEKLLPSTLVVKYERRKPLAILGNLKDSGIDNEGIVFPLVDVQSFETPTLYLSASEGQIDKWGKKIDKTRLRFLQESLLHFNTPDVAVVSVDLSRVQLASLGSREAVVVLRIVKTGKTFTVRLPVDKVSDSGVIVKQMLSVPDIQIEGGEIADLRVAPFGFFKPNQNAN